MSVRLIVRILILWILLMGLSRIPGPPDSAAAPAKTWPFAVPCRIQDGPNKDLFVMVLGDVDTPLAQGMYDPSTDTATLKDGTARPHYFKDTLGVKYFVPMDKSIFPLPPSGLCTWYYYYQDINENEVKANARWIAENLADYGAQYVQIDDGWQGETAEGRHGSRDWTTIDKAFPGGMASLAAYIKSIGLKPGIWLAPHGQSNETVVKSLPGVFLFKPDGTSASESWEGKFLVDPSAAEAHAYLKDLFTKLVGWGYEYFKIDGQPVVVGEYRRAGAFMKNQGDPEALYRKTIETIRGAIGPKRYLLGCWGIPLEGAGFMNGSRTGGDVVLGWSGFFTALRTTMRWYFTHNIVWYADPDTMLVRPPLTIDQARVWATLQGLTGQALMSSDRLMDLSGERVELLRRVYPATDIRPLDLFPSFENKRIWDLKISHLDRRYDVVGVFNFGEVKSEQIRLDWKELGLPADGPVHVFDFWNKEYLGAWERGMSLMIPPTSCRVLTLMPASDRIQVISTSRHITQGWVDLVSLTSASDGRSFAGRSRLIKGDPYEIRFVFPRGKNYAIKEATARTSSGILPVATANHQGWATVRIESPKTIEATWDVRFEPADSYRYPTQAPGGLQVERIGLDGADFRWQAQYYLNAGYQVYLDGALLGYTPNTSFLLSALDPRRTYTAEVRAVWDDGTIGERHKPAELKFMIASLVPEGLPLADLEPVRGASRAGPGRTLTLTGKRYENGIGLAINSEIEYDLYGFYDTFSALVGLDEGAGPGAFGPGGAPAGGMRSGGAQAVPSVEFIVLADGKELWRSGAMNRGDAPKPVSLSLAGARRLVLRTAGGAQTGSGEMRRGGPLAVWAEARVSGQTASR
jgi:hypothetical protein